jgi:SAM-dependent methyltransferase
MVFDFFRRGSAAAAEPSAARISRRSSGLAEFTKLLAGKEDLTILDLGPTSPQNIRHITELGHRIYNEDVLACSHEPEFQRRLEDGTKSVDAALFLKQNLKYSAAQFDAVLCWDVPDYLNESLVKPLIDHLAVITKPGSVLLAYFHTKDAGGDVPHYRYNIAGNGMLELQRGPDFKLQRAFNNRHIENLFREFTSMKFFLSRDNIREVLVVR